MKKAIVFMLSILISVCLLTPMIYANNNKENNTDDTYFKCEMFDNKYYKEMTSEEIDDIFFQSSAEDVGYFLSNLSEEDYNYILDKSVYLNEPNVEYKTDDNGNVVDATSTVYYEYAKQQYKKTLMRTSFVKKSGYYTLKMVTDKTSTLKVTISINSLSADSTQKASFSISGTNNHGIKLKSAGSNLLKDNAGLYCHATPIFTYDKPNENVDWSWWKETGDIVRNPEAAFNWQDSSGENTLGTADGEFGNRINIAYNAGLDYENGEHTPLKGNGIATMTLQGKSRIYVRYENADGTFMSYESKYSKWLNDGDNYSWSQTETDEWKATSVSKTCDINNVGKDTKVTVYRKTYDTTLNMGNNAIMTVDDITYNNNDVIEGKRWGSTINLSTPVRKGYIFKGWSVTGNGSSIQDNVLTLGTENTIVTANWEEVKAEGITLDTDNVTLYTKESYTIIPTITPEDTLNKTVTWKSLNDNIATVDKSGKVTGVKAGECDVTATTDDGTSLTATAHITVKQHPEKIEMEKEVVMYTDDLPHQLEYEVLPEDATNKNVSFVSNDITIATVTADGVISPVKAGECDITATTVDGNIKAECHVIVKQYAKSIKLDRNKLLIKKETTDKLQATILPENTTNKEIKWTSSNPDIVSVDENGNIEAKENGKATITVTTTDGTNLSDTCEVEVIRLANDIKLNTDNIELYVDEEEQLQATVLPNDTVNKNVTWTSTDNSIATVDSNGKVTGVKAGKCQITVKTTDGTDISAICNVTVKQYAKSIDVEDEKTVYTNNLPFSLEYEILPEDTTNKTVKWTSSNTEVATVDENTGMITPVKAGECDIVATTTDGTDLSDSCHLTVNQYVTDIEINFADLLIEKHGNNDISYDKEKNMLLMKKGTSIVLPLNILPEDATNKELNFSNNNNKIATINSDGKVSAKEIGVSNISITAEDDMKISKDITVKVYDDITSPTTGDDTYNTLWTFILCVSIFGLIIVSFTFGLLNRDKDR